MGSRSLKNRHNIKKKHPFTGVLVALSILVAVFAAGAMGVYALGASWLEDLPEYSDSDVYNTARKTEVYANDGATLLAEFYVENREPVTMEQISPLVISGTIATEDERFYEHDGIDLWGIGRALVVNITGQSREGASTITQQFVRATVLADEATDISLKRKVREMYISLKLEEMFTKDEILLMYLNTINYGAGAYGIEAASHAYFSKPATELSLVEAATLVGIPQSPTYNNPIDNPDNCLNRRNLVLERMLSNSYITQEEYDAAVATPLELNPEQKSDNGIYLYPYFTSHVRDTLIEQFSEAEVFKGGLKVYTTIDPSIQAAAEEAARKKESTLADDVEVALTAVDPNTGFVKAMVGGRDFYADQYNLATQAKRSCGSSFKTFTLVAALEEGISPYSSISCSARVKINDWQVENYGGSEYGTRTITSAFAVSSNTAFARLITVLGPEKVIDVAHRLGIESTLPNVPAITLGAVGVSTDEMAGAYATIANGGTHHDVTCIERIYDRNGEEIFVADTTGERVITPEIAYAATNVMKGVVTGGTGTAASLYGGQPVAGKTGTSENWHDSYFVGFTPQISVAIWLGARNERQMPEYYTATSVFRDFVTPVLAGQEIMYFPTANEPTYSNYTSLNVGSGTSYNYSYNYSDSDDDDSADNASSSSNATNNSQNSGSNSGSNTGSTPSTPDNSGSGTGSGSSGSGSSGNGSTGSGNTGSAGSNSSGSG
ncbi:MAG: transglycosylase domain-containing protein [Raoultibacter sp.]